MLIFRRRHVDTRPVPASALRLLPLILLAVVEHAPNLGLTGGADISRLRAGIFRRKRCILSHALQPRASGLNSAEHFGLPIGRGVEVRGQFRGAPRRIARVMLMPAATFVRMRVSLKSLIVGWSTSLIVRLAVLRSGKCCGQSDRTYRDENEQIFLKHGFPLFKVVVDQLLRKSYVTTLKIC